MDSPSNTDEKQKSARSRIIALLVERIVTEWLKERESKSTALEQTVQSYDNIDHYEDHHLPARRVLQPIQL